MRAPGGMRRSGKLVIAHVTREKVSALIDYTGGLDGTAADNRHPLIGPKANQTSVERHKGERRHYGVEDGSGAQSNRAAKLWGPALVTRQNAAMQCGGREA